MLNGVWTAQDATITRNVTQRACGSPGSVSTARQLSSPDGMMAPIPSHVVKLSANTPTSGMTAKPTKNTRAGAASHGRMPLWSRRRARPARVPRAVGSLASSVIDIGSLRRLRSLADDRVEVVRELLRGDGQL